MKRILFILLLAPFFIFSQKAALSRANIDFDNFQYFRAIKTYESLVEKGLGTPEIYEKLANAYYENASYVKANSWFEKYYEINPNMTGENHYRYSNTLKAIGDTLTSVKQLEYFELAHPNQIRTKLLQSKIAHASPFSVSNIRAVSFNSATSDYGTIIKGDTLFFSSSRGQVSSDRVSLRTGQYNTNLYQSVKGINGVYSDPKLFSLTCYSIYNEATPVFSKDGKTIYFTQNFVDNNSKTKLINEGFKLYKATLKNKIWQNQESITFQQKDSVNIAHPALSPDGKFMYFASDMPGTNGASDIFKIEINQDGSFGKIDHLSSKINTEGRESFPFITENNYLIFASDGHPGKGGLDLYSIDLLDPNAEVSSLGSSINSAFDDFALVLNTNQTKGYFTSNRPGGVGDDDIYSFDVKLVADQSSKNNSIVSYIDLKGTIKDDIANESLSNVHIALVDKTNIEIAKTKTDQYGNYSFKGVKSNSDYELKLTKFDKTVRLIPINVLDKDIETSIEINKNLVIPKVDITKVSTKSGIDIAKELKIDQIYFDSNKYNIRADAEIDLDLLVAFMKLNPSIKIEIGSHTDCIGSTDYNLILSQKRAQSTLNYIVGQGIDLSRLIAVGYGESKLINNCSDGVICTKEQNQQNRRSTFIIINN